MKKILLSLILILFLLPTVVFAEDTVEIKSIDFVEKSENTKINTEASTDGEKINLDLTFYDKDDYATYKVVVKNPTDTSLFINDKYFNTGKEYVYYGFEYSDGNNIVRAGEEKTFNMKVSYNQEVEKTNFRSGKYDLSSTDPLILSDKLLQIPNTLKNLGILGTALLVVVIACIGVGLYVLFKNKKGSEINILIIGLFLILSPKMVDALVRIEIPIDAKIIVKMVKDNPCTYGGELVQGATYTNGQYTYTYMPTYTYPHPVYFDRIETEILENGWGVVLTDKDSTDPVTTKLCTTINDKPIVSMESMFADSKASSFDLSSFDTSNVKVMKQMFMNTSNNTEEASYIGIEYLDTSNVIDLTEAFQAACTSNVCKRIELDLSRWDVGKVIRDSNFIYSCGNSADYIKVDMSNWNLESIIKTNDLLYNSGANAKKYDLNVSNMNIPLATDLSHMFGYIGSQTEEFNIDVSNIKFPSATKLTLGFYVTASNSKVVNIEGLNTWDVSNLSDLSSMFEYFAYRADDYILDLSNWDVSNVDTFYRMLHNCGTHKNVYINVSGWKIKSTASVTDFLSYSFNGSEKIEINMSNWDLSGHTTIGQIFQNNGYGSLEYKLDLSNWKVNDLESIDYLFHNCGTSGSKKVYLDISGWETSSLTSMNGTFYGLGAAAEEITIKGLKELDLSKVQKMNGTFIYSGNLEFDNFHIYADEVASMFTGAQKIKGNIILHNNVTSYSQAFTGTNASSEDIFTVDYYSAVTDIDNLIATSYNSGKVVKGSLIED